MRDKFLLTSLGVLIAIGLTFLEYPEVASALLLVLALSFVALSVFRFHSPDKNFITSIFLVGLLLRMGFGIIVHAFDLRVFFGGDANAYDMRGNLLMESWMGHVQYLDAATQQALSTTSAGWGMNYLVAAIYAVFGRNILAAQSFCAVVGAATAPMVFFCAKRIFQNDGVARFSAIAVALFPSFIIWSGQLLKDGLIIFLLVLAMTMVLQLQERFNYAALALLFLSLGGILALRFYIFYMVAIAIAGSLLIGTTNSSRSLARRTAALVFLGLGVTYFGVTRNATENLERYGNLDQLQNSRLDLARTGQSGFAEDVDVSTSGGALSIIPLGFTYLMLAPFPWEVTNMRQAITLPEVLAWWSMLPFMAYGLWWAIKNKLRSAFPILIFSLMLTLAYSIFQGNVGTAYRQRTQIQVFLFIFIAVGWQLFRERKADKKIIREAQERRIQRALQARTQ